MHKVIADCCVVGSLWIARWRQAVCLYHEQG